MKKLTAFLLFLSLLLGGVALADVAYARLNQPIATRSGPGTDYFEPGTFLQQGDYVTVLTKVWDSMNEIWWVQVEFHDGYDLRRAYTGAQRMSVNLSNVPEENPLGIIRVTRDADAWGGPSNVRYNLWGESVWRGTSAILLEVEAGYGHIECWNETWNQPWRVWVDLDYLSCRDQYSDSDDTYPSGDSFASNPGYSSGNSAPSYDASSSASTNSGSSDGYYNTTVEISPVGQTCRIVSTSANARSGAGTQYSIIQYVFRGERYVILDTAVASNGKTWFKIEKDRTICWISSGVTDMNN